MTTEDIHTCHADCQRPTCIAVREAVAAEREAIAQMIEDSPPLVFFAKNEMGGCVMCGFTPKLAALTIRERGAP
jgi:hypothetical protein